MLETIKNKILCNIIEIPHVMYCCGSKITHLHDSIAWKVYVEGAQLPMDAPAS